MKVTANTLRKILKFEIVDPCSASSWMQRIYIQKGVKCEEFQLRLEAENSIHCMLLYSRNRHVQSALIYLQEGAEFLNKLSWLKAIIDEGLAVLGVDLGKSSQVRSPAGEVVASIRRVVSYLSLRNDLVDPSRIFCYGKRELGVFGLYTTILDGRIHGLVLEKVPLKITLFDNNQMSKEENECGEKKKLTALLLPVLTALVAPRPLAILNCLNHKKGICEKKNMEEAFKKTRTSYEKMESATKLRLEKDGKETLFDLFQWITSFR